jgi:predicted transcriptional regulator
MLPKHIAIYFKIMLFIENNHPSVQNQKVIAENLGVHPVTLRRMLKAVGHEKSKKWKKATIYLPEQKATPESDI